MRKLKISTGDRFGPWTVEREMSAIMWPCGRKSRVFAVRNQHGVREFLQLKTLKSWPKVRAATTPMQRRKK